MKNWDDYRFVLALHRSGTMGLAANALGVTTVTVSRRIERISEAVGLRLFDFRNNRWIATEAGETIARVATQIEEEDSFAASFLTQTGQELRGAVVINALSFINSYFLAGKVGALKQLHPHLVPVLDASDAKVSLARGEADIAIRLEMPEDGRLVRAPVGLFPIGLYSGPAGPDGEWIGLPERLDRVPEMKLGYQVFGKPPSLRVDSFPGIAKAIGDTGMVGIIPTCIAGHFPEVRPFMPDRAIVVRNAWAVYHEMNRGQKTIEETLNWIRTALRGPRSCACGGCNYG